MKYVLPVMVMLGMAVPTALHAEERKVSCLAEGIYHEARGESTDGRIGVASVIMNRVRGWKNTVCAIVYQRSSSGCQFSWACRAHPIKDKIVYNEALVLAKNVLSGKISDNTSGAKYFHRCGKTRGNINSDMVLTNKIGHQCFYAPISEMEYSLSTIPGEKHAKFDYSEYLWYQDGQHITG